MQSAMVCDGVYTSREVEILHTTTAAAYLGATLSESLCSYFEAGKYILLPSTTKPTRPQIRRCREIPAEEPQRRQWCVSKRRTTQPVVQRGLAQRRRRCGPIMARCGGKATRCEVENAAWRCVGGMTNAAMPQLPVPRVQKCPSMQACTHTRTHT